MDVLGESSYKAEMAAMVKKSTRILKIRLRKYGKMYVCVIAALSTISVWVATSDKQTIERKKMYSLAENDSLYEEKKTRQTVLSGINSTAVILLTYMRSGSSITGDILQQTDATFYVFEPFRMLNYLIKSRKPLQWLNGTVSSTATMDTRQVKKKTLIGWMTCNFTMIYAQAFDDWYFFSFGKKTDIYNKCIFKHYGLKKYIYIINNSTRTRPLVRKTAYRRGPDESCLQALRNACLASKYRIVKTIRTQMTLAGDILDEVKGSKIIHLIRDPRPTVISQARYHGCPGQNTPLTICSEWHCGNVLADTLVKEDILSKRPKGILTVLYEHIVSYPSITTEIMYKFLGMKFTGEINGYARNITSGGTVTGCTVCEQSWQSRNSSNISLQREQLLSKYNMSVLLYIQNICSEIMTHYGYEFYNSSQIK